MKSTIRLVTERNTIANEINLLQKKPAVFIYKRVNQSAVFDERALVAWDSKITLIHFCTDSLFISPDKRPCTYIPPRLGLVSIQFRVYQLD